MILEYESWCELDPACGVAAALSRLASSVIELPQPITAWMTPSSTMRNNGDIRRWEILTHNLPSAAPDYTNPDAFCSHEALDIYPQDKHTHEHAVFAIPPWDQAPTLLLPYLTSGYIKELHPGMRLDSARACQDNRLAMENNIPDDHRSGFVAVIGKPNVGKSTLINRYLGQSVVPVSPRAQTTIRRQLGILTLPHAQVIFVDTPGIHKPQHKLGERMNLAAQMAMDDADALLVIFDLSQPPAPDDARVTEEVQAFSNQIPTLCVPNKMDMLSSVDVDNRINSYRELLPEADVFPISATRGDNCDALLQQLIEYLPEGPRYYPEDELTELFERDIAADMIRASCLQLLREEVPYCIAVRIDAYKERNQHGAYIEATLFVERESQKGIVIGKKGHMLREIGTLARKEIEAMSGRKTYLDLKVSVFPRWRNDESAIQRFGYSRPKR
jgi:GTP-binding protein Era